MGVKQSGTTGPFWKESARKIRRILCFELIPLPRRKRNTVQSFILSLAISLCIFYLMLLLIAVFYSDRMIFPVPAPTYRDNRDIIRLPMPDGSTVAGFYSEIPSARATLLFHHGNAEDLGDIRPFLLDLQRRLRINVMGYDYPGYGTSEGRPGEQRVYDSAEAAYRYLVKEQGIAPETILHYGRSLGGGPAIRTAARHPAGGMILDSTFVSTFRVMTRWPLVPWDKFPNLATIGDVECPVMIIHGTADQTVPFWHAGKLYSRLSNPGLLITVDKAGHNNLIDIAGERYWDALEQFIHQHFHE